MAASKLLPMLKRGFWGPFDQVISSGTNFLVAIAIATSATASEFGAFALVSAGYLLVLNVARGVVAETFVVTHADRPPTPEASGRATGAAFVVGTIGAATCAGAALLASDPTISQLTAILAAGLPGLLLLDTWRYISFTDQLGIRVATYADASWLGMFVLVWVVLGAYSASTILTLFAAWVLAGALAGAGTSLALRTWPNPATGIAWLGRERHLSVRYGLELSVLGGGKPTMYWLIGAMASLEVTGIVRGAELLFGPASVMIMGMQIFLVPETRKRFRRGRDGLVGHAVLVSSLAVLCVLAWFVMLLQLPHNIGQRVLGDVWASAREIVTPIAVYTAATASTLGPLVALRARQAAAASLVARIVTVCLLLGAIATAIALSGDHPGAAALGAAAGLSLAAGVWWFALLRTVEGKNADRHERVATP